MLTYYRHFSNVQIATWIKYILLPKPGDTTRLWEEDILLKYFHFSKECWLGTCLVLQWLRICMLMWGHEFQLWSTKILQALRQQSLCTTTTQPTLWGPKVATTEPMSLEPTLRNTRGQHNEKPAHCNQTKSAHSSRDPAQPKRNTSFKKVLAGTIQKLMQKLLYYIVNSKTAWICYFCFITLHNTFTQSMQFQIQMN